MKASLHLAPALNAANGLTLLRYGVAVSTRCFVRNLSRPRRAEATLIDDRVPVVLLCSHSFLRKLLLDPEGGIRVNTIVCLGRIARHFDFAKLREVRQVVCRLAWPGLPVRDVRFDSTRMCW